MRAPSRRLPRRECRVERWCARAAATRRGMHLHTMTPCRHTRTHTHTHTDNQIHAHNRKHNHTNTYLHNHVYPIFPLEQLLELIIANLVWDCEQCNLIVQMTF